MGILLYTARVIGTTGPVAFVLLYTDSVKNPGKYDTLFIQLQRFLPAPETKGPLLPTKHSQAWNIGKISGLLTANTISNESAVTSVASVLGVPEEDVSVEAILDMGSFLEQHEQHKTGWAKVLSVWSFVNIMWVISIIGVTVTVGPALYILFGPLFARLIAICRACILYIHHHIWPFYVLLYFYICLCILTSARHYPARLAPFIALTGCALAIPTFYLSLQQLDLDLTALDGTVDFSIAIINFLAFLTFAAAAIDTSSSLVAFASVVALFGALGFEVIPFTCYWVFGYDTDFTMFSSMIASSIILASMLTLKSFGRTPSTLALFEPGVSIMGGVALGVAGLIVSTSSYYYGDHFWLINTMYLLVCCALIFAGSVMRLTPLRCTSTVFLVLWVCLKVIEFTSSQYMIVLIFVGCLLSWYLSFFLKAHPEYILSLFNLFRTPSTAPRQPLGSPSSTSSERERLLVASN